MSKYTATIKWSRNGQTFIDNKYKRAHRWEFDNGQIISASASPNIVPTPLSDPSAIDPEEAFIAALSSCHMLWFLSIAAKAGYVVENYKDKAEGILAKNNEGKQAITEVSLFPQVTYQKGQKPTEQKDQQMHQQASTQCFIANSVETKVKVEPAIHTTAH